MSKKSDIDWNEIMYVLFCLILLFGIPMASCANQRRENEQRTKIKHIYGAIRP